LFYAIEYRQFEIIKLLTQYHADLNYISQDGNTVLHYAAKCPTEDILVISFNIYI